MRIAMVSEHANPLAAGGGQHLFVAELSAALAREGHTVTVYTGQDAAKPSDLGYEVVHVPTAPAEYLGDFARFLRDEWAADPPDVAHAHHWRSGLAATAAGRVTDVPVVQSFHGLGVVERRHHRESDPRRISAERALGREVARVAATSSDEVNELARLGVPKPRISLVPCGVDLREFTPVGDTMLKDGAPLRLVSVGDLVPPAGFGAVIAVLQALPDTELIIVGGPDKAELGDHEHARFLRAYAESVGVGDRVHLVGGLARRDLPPLLRSANAVVCTPWYEPFGFVALEAMACGAPVVATAVGGLADTVVDDVTGVLVPPRRPRALAEALRRLLARPSTLEQMGAAGCDRAMSRYSWERVASEIARVYAQATVGSGKAVGTRH